MIIYLVTNHVTSKSYVGQTIRTLKKRWACHCNKGDYLYNSILKHGKENFTIKQIDSATTQEDLNQKEIYWIEKLNTLFPNGYNLRKGGNSGGKLSDITRKRVGLSGKGRKHSEEWKRKASERFKGKNNPMYGKTLSKEAQEKRLIKMNEHYKDPEYLKKMSEIGKKRVLSDPNYKEKMGSYTKEYYSKKENRELLKQRSIELHKNEEYVIKRARAMGGKPFMCVETGETFFYLRQAAEKLNLNKKSIHSVLTNRRKTHRGYSFKFVENNQ